MLFGHLYVFGAFTYSLWSFAVAPIGMVLSMLLNYACMCAHSLSCVLLFATLWTVGHQASLSMKLSSQEYWNGLPFPFPGHLPNPEIKPASLVFADGFFTTSTNTGGLDWEFGIGRCKILHLEWINNKILMYSKGNYIQYPLINHNGKEY